MHLHKKIITYQDIDVNANELITIREAATLLHLSIPGLANAIARGRFTEIVDIDAGNGRHNRRFLLRSEVEVGS
jgi:hypothetical protein